MDEKKKLTPEEIEELIKSGEITEGELEEVSGGIQLVKTVILEKVRRYDEDD